MSDFSESCSPGTKQEHSEQLYPSPSGISIKTCEEQKSSVGVSGKEAIDIEEDLNKNPSRQMDPSSFTSLDEEITTTGGFSSKITNQSGNQYSHNSQLEGFTLNMLDSCKTSIKDSMCMIRSMPDVINESAPGDANNHKICDSLQMIEERGDEENAESPMNKKSNPPGIYSAEERAEKILHYKKKIMKWRLAHPPNRNFLGRSFVAGNKPRIKGKFVSREEYTRHVEMIRRNQFFNMMPRSFSMFNLFAIKNEEK